MENYKMNFSELQVTLSFCIIFLLRMLGMFMILPVLSKYGVLLEDGNKFLIGLSIGIYGIAQIIFQIPFGILSDKFGRKKIIIFGLFIFFIGNIICASVHSIWGLIIGRFLQGSGAISGVCMAFLSDLIRKKNRVKAIACVGVSFAFSFLIAMISGPLIVKFFGFFSIFWVSSFLSIICIIVVFFMLPLRSKYLSYDNKNILYSILLSCIFNTNFMRSYIGIFFIHFLLMMNFTIIPNQFELSGLILSNHWIVYLFTILFAFFILFFFISYCKIQYILDYIIEICIFFLFISNIIFILSINCLLFLIIALQIFFISFNFLEVFLPSNLNKQKLYDYKGSVMSIYSTSQFLGISFGGILSGWLYTFLDVLEMFTFQMLIIFIWFILSLFCKKK